jgi:hypothetical protein
MWKAIVVAEFRILCQNLRVSADESTKNLSMPVPALPPGAKQECYPRDRNILAEIDA